LLEIYHHQSQHKQMILIGSRRVYMAATKGQGKAFSVFLAGITIACAGLAYIGSGSGKLALIVGLVMLAASFIVTLKLKPQEGVTAEHAQSAILKLAGIVLCAGGWILAVVGLNVASSNGARLIATLIGIAVTLVGVIVVLPKACNQGAIWKA
jgi:hypothetical protein